MWTYLTHRYNAWNSWLLALPVFLVYHLGILFIDTRNGVDFVSDLAFSLLKYSTAAYAAATIGVVVVGAFVSERLRRKTLVVPKGDTPDQSSYGVRFGMVVLEGAVWAALMTFCLRWSMDKLFPVSMSLPGRDQVERVVLSLGAGLHEELVFRLLLFAGAARFLQRIELLPSPSAHLLTAVASSALFGAAHYVGPLGEVFSWDSFTFRLLAGMFLAGLYALRGFAPAVYTHGIYDIGLTLLRPVA